MSAKNDHPHATYYVAPTGDDNNPGTEQQPFRTIEKARGVVRTINKNMTGDIAICLRDGTHTIDRTIVFDHNDSGSNGYSVVYKSYSKGKATISGGRQISGWQPDSDGRWKASTDIADFRQLYVNGRRAIRARGEAPADIEEHGLRGFFTHNDEMAEWGNQADIECCSIESFCHTRCKVYQIVKCPWYGGIVEIRMLQPHFTLAKSKAGRQVVKPTYFENAFELLTEPGEWYLDKATHTLYYIPRPGEDMAEAEVIAPVVERLVELKGTLDDPVSNIEFRDITFAHATWLEPNRIGFVDLQANFRLGPGLRLYAIDGHPLGNGIETVHGESFKSPANIVCHAARSVHFTGCVFTKLGGAAIDIEHGAEDNVVSGCEFYDISGTAIQVGDVLKDDHHPDDDRLIVRNNTIQNNYIHDVAVEYMGGVGIFAGYTDGTLIAHNELCNLPYSGVSVGWGWGGTDAGGGAYDQPFHYDTPTPSKNNRIEYNHIHHVGETLKDTAGIYTLGNMPGSVIRGNHIHDNTEWYGGIYLDEGSGYIEVTENVVYDVGVMRGKPINCNNLNQDRIATCDEHDNYFGVERKDIEFPESIVANAGLEPEYQHMLKPGKGEE